jgi:PAS domain-containing protein
MRWDRVTGQRLGELIATANGDLHLMISFLAMLPVPAYVKDKKGRLLYLNPMGERLWKVKASEVLGKTVPQVLGKPQLEAQTQSSDKKVLKRDNAHVYFHLVADTQHYSVLQFTFLDADDDRLIAGLVVEHG